METTSDSDISEGTQDLVRQGLASVWRKRIGVALQLERLPERLSVPNMDTSRIRRPLYQEGLISIALTYGLSMAERESSEAQNHNNTVSEWLKLKEYLYIMNYIVKYA